MAKYLISDFASTTLATAIAEGATSCTVSAGTGSEFPEPNDTTGTKFIATLQQAADLTVYEEVTVTIRSTDTMTITPTVNAYNAGDIFALRPCADLMEQLVQFDDLQAQAGNYAVDTGSANAYEVTLSPSISTPFDGLVVRVKAANSNTGNSTLNGSPIKTAGGSQIASGVIVATWVFVVIWSAANDCWQLLAG